MAEMVAVGARKIGRSGEAAGKSNFRDGEARLVQQDAGAYQFGGNNDSSNVRIRPAVASSRKSQIASRRNSLNPAIPVSSVTNIVAEFTFQNL
jgi:hypothetical protein